MQIVINIDEEIIKDAKDSPNYYPTYHFEKIWKAVVNGIPLPKGHGDLKDMNDLCYKSRHGCKGNCDYLHVCNLYKSPTIIKADKQKVR